MLTQKLLQEFLNYDPETGIFTWKERGSEYFPTHKDFRAWNGRFPGTTAGSFDWGGYVVIRILSKDYKAHRLAWLYVNGEMPESETDHINGIRDDNRIYNLRMVSHRDNARNRKMPANNSSGCIGVSMLKKSGKWVARISVDGVYAHIGLFDDWFEAVCARKSAENRYGYHENHGRILPS